jgi:hypothetical protein
MISRKLGRLFLIIIFFNSGCATYTKNIALGMTAGAVLGAAVGSQMGGQEDRTRNTIVGAVGTALLAGGILAWHYREMEEQSVEISGRYSRMRLCNPEEMQIDKTLQFDHTSPETGSAIYQIPDSQIGKVAITLDDSTKWVYPTFRKRYLAPELQESQVLSQRYIWEIIKPGSFVTRSLNPQFFVEPLRGK